MFINYDLLLKMPSGRKACDDALEWFEEEFPNGGELEAVWDACEDNAWKVWFTCHYVSFDERQALAWKFAGQAFRFAAEYHPELEEFADNVNEDNWEEARDKAYASYASSAFSYASYASFASSSAASSASFFAYAAYASFSASYASSAVFSASYAAFHARKEQAEWCEDILFGK